METTRTRTAAVCAAGDPGFPERYRAISARDARFDGQFITGVTSTGIYCRPSCPARTPRPDNVVFLLTSAAAHEAGFRACRRCLPEAVPGTPAWNLRSDVAARAMRLIADGVVDRDGVPGLAERLGFTSRHLTRLLAAELGAGPLALARAHRAQTARTLATESDLPFADIAFAAGFGSVRQFNDTVREVFATTPGELRLRRRRPPRRSPAQASPADSSHADPASADPVPSDSASADPSPLIPLSVTLPVRLPFDADGLFGFLAARAITGVEVADLSDPVRLRYARTLALPHGPAVAEVVAASQPSPRPASPHADADGWTLTAHLRLTSLADAPAAISRLRRMLDLDADPRAVDAELSGDELLAPLVDAAPGVRVPGSVDAHELAVRAVIGQQISVAAARTHLGRLVDRAGTPVETGTPGLTALFPTAGRIAETVAPVPAGTPLDPARPLRLPRRSLATVHDLCCALAAGALDLHLGMDSEDLRTSLQSRPGIGPWTAAYVAMRVLGDPDAWLPGDAALAAAARRLGCDDDLDARAARWAPWRSYAVVRLWRTNSAPRTSHTAPSPTPSPPNEEPPRKDA